MPDTKKVLAWIASFVLVSTMVGGLWSGAIAIGRTVIAYGEILHEMNRVAVAVEEIKKKVNEDRSDTERLIRELADEQRKIEQRLQVLEIYNGNLETRGLKR